MSSDAYLTVLFVVKHSRWYSWLLITPVTAIDIHTSGSRKESHEDFFFFDFFFII